MRYVIGIDSIGIDGGHTGTTAIIADENGRLLGAGYGVPMTSLQNGGSVERMRRALSDAVRTAVATADLQNARIAAVCVGLTGAVEMMEETCMPVIPTDRLIFGQDTRVVLYSVTCGRPGAIVLAGERAVAYGVNNMGEQASAGGWGHVLGDEGSGYWIAIRALNACCRANDEMDAPTQMLPMMLKHLDVTDLEQVSTRIQTGAIQQTELASLQEIVRLAAAQGDGMARRILREAGKELALTVSAVIKRLRMENETVMVGAAGDVFRVGRAVLRTFRERVKQTAPLATILPVRMPLAVGAALMALEEIDVPLHDDLLANIQATLTLLKTHVQTPLR